MGYLSRRSVLMRETMVCLASHGIPQGSRRSSMYWSRRGIAHVLFCLASRLGLSRHIWVMALKAVGLFELMVAECTRLTGCSPVGLGLLQPQTSSWSSPFCFLFCFVFSLACLVFALRLFFGFLCSFALDVHMYRHAVSHSRAYVFRSLMGWVT